MVPGRASRPSSCASATTSPLHGVDPASNELRASKAGGDCAARRVRHYEKACWFRFHRWKTFSAEALQTRKISAHPAA